MKNKKPLFLRLLATLILVGPTFWLNADSIDKKSDQPISTEDYKTTPIDWSILGFTLGKTELKEVLKNLGKAEQTNRPDGITEVCYQSKDPKDKSWIRFEFQDKRLFSFDVSAHSPVDHCALSAKVSQSMQISRGLGLGMNQKDLNAVLGEPTSSIENRLTWAFYEKRKMTPSERKSLEKTFQTKIQDNDAFWDVTSNVGVTVEQSHVKSFDIQQSESY